MKKLFNVTIAVLSAISLVLTGCSSAAVNSESDIFYSKDNKLLRFNGKKAETLSENMSSGGTFSYYYVGWGVEHDSDKTGVYYQSDVTEEGSFTLNYKNFETNDSAVISQKVSSFKSDGTTSVAYIKDAVESRGTLCIYAEGNEFVIDEGVVISEASYELSGDGQYVFYLKETETSNDLYMCNVKDGKPELLGKNIAQFVAPHNSETVFFVEGEETTDGDYKIYKKDFDGEKELLADRATALISLTNNKDILYTVNTKEELSYDSILEDTLADSDENVREPQSRNYTEVNIDDYNTDMLEYESKLARDILREEVNGKTFYDHSDDLYIYKDGKSTMLKEDMIEVVGIDEDGSVIAYSVAENFEFSKVNISDITDVEELMEVYYESLGQAAKEVYILTSSGESQKIDLPEVNINSIQISKDKSKLLIFSGNDQTTGAGDLYLFEIIEGGKIGDGIKLGEDVYSAQFSGANNDVAFMTAFDGIKGTLSLYSNGETKVVSETANNYRYGKANDVIYYTDQFDQTTLWAVLNTYENGNVKKIDDSVFIIDTKENGNVVYFKNYNSETSVGDIYLFDGKKPKLIDTNVSCLFFI